MSNDEELLAEIGVCQAAWSMENMLLQAYRGVCAAIEAFLLGTGMVLLNAFGKVQSFWLVFAGGIVVAIFWVVVSTRRLEIASMWSREVAARAAGKLEIRDEETRNKMKDKGKSLKTPYEYESTMPSLWLSGFLNWGVPIVLTIIWISLAFFVRPGVPATSEQEVRDMDLLVPVAIPFAATFAGVFLAYYLAAMQERNKRKAEEREMRNKVRATLDTELTAVKANLDGAVNLTQEGKIGDIPNIDLPTDAKESVVNSGKFSLLKPELQLEVSHIYAVIERAEVFLSQMREFVVSPALALSNSGKIFGNIKENFWGQVQHLRQHIPTLVEKLQKDD